MFQVFRLKIENLAELGKAHREFAIQRNSGFVTWDRNTIILSWRKLSETNGTTKNLQMLLPDLTG